MSENETSEKLGPCPNCGGAFEQVRVGPYVVDRCASCAGLWLDEHELERVMAVDHRALKQKRITEPPAVRSGGRRSCPSCGGTLIKLANLHANITTDSCSVCYGMFLDAGELEALDHPNLAGRMGQLLRKLVGRH
nr:zf-TFIIB domain-containing protein [Chloroflexota bacterium]